MDERESLGKKRVKSATECRQIDEKCVPGGGPLRSAAETGVGRRLSQY
jgi:hypothetical protein